MNKELEREPVESPRGRHSFKKIPILEFPIEKHIDFVLDEGKNSRKVKYGPLTKYEDILAELKIEDTQRIEIQIKRATSEEYKILSQGQLVAELISSDENLKGRLVERFVVKSAGGERYFVKGTSTYRIRNAMNAKGCIFFDLKHVEYSEEELNQDLLLLECQECKVVFKKEIFRKKSVPTGLPVKEVASYLQIKGP